MFIPFTYTAKYVTCIQLQEIKENYLHFESYTLNKLSKCEPSKIKVLRNQCQY